MAVTVDPQPATTSVQATVTQRVQSATCMSTLGDLAACVKALSDVVAVPGATVTVAPSKDGKSLVVTATWLVLP